MPLIAKVIHDAVRASSVTFATTHSQKKLNFSPRSASKFQIQFEFDFEIALSLTLAEDRR
jgi:hypothetical protein